MNLPLIVVIIYMDRPVAKQPFLIEITYNLPVTYEKYTLIRSVKEFQDIKIRAAIDKDNVIKLGITK